MNGNIFLLDSLWFEYKQQFMFRILKHQLLSWCQFFRNYFLICNQMAPRGKSKILRDLKFSFQKSQRCHLLLSFWTNEETWVIVIYVLCSEMLTWQCSLFDDFAFWITLSENLSKISKYMITANSSFYFPLFLGV